MSVELTDQQYEVLQRGAAFLQEAATKPETRRAFEKIAKTLRPEIETSDDIAEAYAAPVRAQLEETNKKLDDFLTAQQQRDKDAAEALDDRKRDDAFARLKAEGYTEEGFDAIKRLMVDRNIADPEAAAALFDRMNPKAQPGPAAWEPDSWNIRDEAVDRDVAGLFTNEDKWADKEVANVLNEIRLGNRS